MGNHRVEYQGVSKRLYDSLRLVECFGLALCYCGLPDGKASFEHECGISGCFFLMQTSEQT